MKMRILIQVLLIFCLTICSLSAQDTAETQNSIGLQYPAGNRLMNFIDIINKHISEYSVQFHSGRSLFVLDNEISESQSGFSNISTTNVVAIEGSPSQTYINYESQSIEVQSLPIDSDTIFLDIVAELRVLPQDFSYADANNFEYFVCNFLFKFTQSESVRNTFVFDRARLNIQGIHTENASSQQLYPGSPLLLWPEQITEETRNTFNLLSFDFNEANTLEKIISYRYDFFGKLYEYQQDTAQGSRIFFALDDSDQGSREIITDENYVILSIRAYDDDGRLRFSDLEENDSNDSGRTSISYEGNGDRIETKIFHSGESEERIYNSENVLIQLAITQANGLAESWNFSYNEDGDILQESYSGAFGIQNTTYEYTDGELSFTQIERNGEVIQTRAINDSMSIETRYIRGEAVLRIYYEMNRRVREEEIINNQIFRTREYN